MNRPEFIPDWISWPAIYKEMGWSRIYASQKVNNKGSARITEKDKAAILEIIENKCKIFLSDNQ